MPAIRIELPLHLRRLCGVSGHEVTVDVPAPVTIGSALDALEAAYPQLAGTIRDHTTRQRRAFLRFFALNEDLSHHPEDTPIPQPVLDGREPFIVLGAIAGG